MIKTLIDLGADPNRRDDGTTPLVAAAMRDHVPSSRRCWRRRRSGAAGAGGFRPLALAIAEGKYEAAKALMEGGADVACRRATRALRR